MTHLFLRSHALRALTTLPVPYHATPVLPERTKTTGFVSNAQLDLHVLIHQYLLSPVRLACTHSAPLHSVWIVLKAFTRLNRNLRNVISVLLGIRAPFLLLLLLSVLLALTALLEPSFVLHVLLDQRVLLVPPVARFVHLDITATIPLAALFNVLLVDTVAVGLLKLAIRAHLEPYLLRIVRLAKPARAALHVPTTLQLVARQGIGVMSELLLHVTLAQLAIFALDRHCRVYVRKVITQPQDLLRALAALQGVLASTLRTLQPLAHPAIIVSSEAPRVLSAQQGVNAQSVLYHLLHAALERTLESVL